MGPNERVLRKAYAAYAIGDVNIVLTHIHPDVRWFVSGDPEIWPLLGLRQGIAEVREFFSLLAREIEYITHDMRELLAQDDERFCVISTMKVRHRMTGEVASSWKIDLIRMKQGLIVEYAEHNDTAALAALRGHTLQAAVQNLANS